jgi:collagenase-like PrtC family protease
MAKGGVDAVIVQDVGLVALIARVAPNLTAGGCSS